MRVRGAGAHQLIFSPYINPSALRPCNPNTSADASCEEERDQWEIMASMKLSFTFILLLSGKLLAAGMC
jgi:hypothetical protein